MKIVVIGGTGLIGSKLVDQARASTGTRRSPRRPTRASTRSPARASPRCSRAPTSSSTSPTRPRSRTRRCSSSSRRRPRNLLAAEAAAGVRAPRRAVGRRHRAPGRQRLLPREDRPGAADRGVRRSRTRSSTRRSSSSSSRASPAPPPTATRSGSPPVLFQPMAADDVAAAVARVAVGAPVNGIIEVARPEQLRMDELVRRRCGRRATRETVVTDPEARYFGVAPGDAHPVARPGRADRRDAARRMGPAAARSRLNASVQVARERRPELLARADAELGEHLAQVVLDGARADEQLRADLRVGVPVARPAARSAPPAA